MSKYIPAVMVLVAATLCLSFAPASKIQESYSKFKSNGKYGLINQDKKVVLPAEYDEIRFNDVYLCITSDNGSPVYDAKLNLLHKFEPEAYEFKMISPSLFYYAKGTRVEKAWYYYSLESNQEFDPGAYLTEGNEKDAPWISHQIGFLSPDFSVNNSDYRRTYPFRYNRAVVLKENWEAAIVDGDFNTVADGLYAAADYYSEGLIPAVYNESKDGKLSEGASCYLDTSGNIVYTCDFNFRCQNRSTMKDSQVREVVGSFHDGMAVVQKKDKSFVILDQNFNHYYLPEEYSVESYTYSNGLLLVSKTTGKSKRYGFADKNCNIAIPCEYTYAEPFDGPYAIVQKSGVDGVIDAAGKFTPVSEFTF